jgi:hypothetical protein
MDDLLKSPWVILGAAALVAGAVYLSRAQDGAGAPDSGGASPPPPPPPGSESASRADDIASGEAAASELLRLGRLASDLDFAHASRVAGEVVVADPRGGIRHDARIHTYHASDAVWPSVKDRFWETLSFTNAGFEYKGDTGRQLLVLIENPSGVFHACQLWRTREIEAAPYAYAYWSGNGRRAGVEGGTVVAVPGATEADPRAVARMHRATDVLVRTKNPLNSRGESLRGKQSGGTFRYEIPYWPRENFSNLPHPNVRGMRWARERGQPDYLRAVEHGVVPVEPGPGSLQWALTQGTRGAAPVLSHWLTPIPFIFADQEGHGDSQYWNLNRATWLSRLHPITGESWRAYSFARWREVPENPDWSFVWWSPFYPQHRADGTRELGEVPKLFEPHLGGGSQLGAAFQQWVTVLNQTGDPPRGQWVGNITRGLPQDCVDDGVNVRCGVGGVQDGCARPSAEGLWSIDAEGCPPMFPAGAVRITTDSVARMAIKFVGG